MPERLSNLASVECLGASESQISGWFLLVFWGLGDFLNFAALADSRLDVPGMPGQASGESGFLGIHFFWGSFSPDNS